MTKKKEECTEADGCKWLNDKCKSKKWIYDGGNGKELIDKISLKDNSNNILKYRHEHVAKFDINLKHEGYMSGLHKSPYHGFSIEFSEHRAYGIGDEVKNIDWKLWS